MTVFWPMRLGTTIAGAAKGASVASEAFHYTFRGAVKSIRSHGLRPGTYATPNGALSPLQAHIDLALPVNRGLPDALIRIDLAGLRQAGYQIPEATQVGRTLQNAGWWDRDAVPLCDSSGVHQGASMNLEQFRNEMVSYRRSVDEEAKALRDSYLALDRLHTLYRKLDSAERAMADQVLAEWALSDDEAVRFDALALIDEFKITNATPALKKLGKPPSIEQRARCALRAAEG